MAAERWGRDLRKPENAHANAHKIAAAIRALARRSSDEQAEVVAWPLDTEDQVEALARECGWNNRRYMTPTDYAGWCDQMRKFARLASPSGVKAGVTEAQIEEVWKRLDGMAYVTIDDVRSILVAALGVSDKGMGEGSERLSLLVEELAEREKPGRFLAEGEDADAVPSK